MIGTSFGHYSTVACVSTNVPFPFLFFLISDRLLYQPVLLFKTNRLDAGGCFFNKKSIAANPDGLTAMGIIRELLVDLGLLQEVDYRPLYPCE